VCVCVCVCVYIYICYVITTHFLLRTLLFVLVLMYHKLTSGCMNLEVECDSCTKQSTVVVNVFHIPCNRLVVQHLIQQLHNQQQTTICRYTLFIIPPTGHNLFSCVPPTCFGCYFRPSSGSQHQMFHTAAVYHEWHVPTYSCRQTSIWICHLHSGGVIRVLSVGVHCMVDGWVL
jgi:hypothetical protein